MNLKPTSCLLPGVTLGPQDRPATLGVVGGGQLGRMFVHAAQAMGFRTVVLDPDAVSPAGQIAHHHIEADYDDADALAAMARLCDAVTTEFENVPAQTLQTLAQQVWVAPQAAAVAAAQNRALEKAHFSGIAAQSGVAPAPHVVLTANAAIPQLPASLFPALLKTARLGYDGKGQVPVQSAADLAQAWAQLNGVDAVLEQRLKLRDECSVILARGHDGQTVHLPLQRNWHHQGILAVSEVAADVLPCDLSTQAIHAARTLAESLNYVGVLCVEFFVVDDGSASGRLVVNEMAPRPHNSGHYSVDACDVSQFELQVRALARLPLSPPRMHSAAVMLNLLGDIWFDHKTPRAPAWDRALALPGVHLHLYGKIEARPGRKMGHITITADTLAQARAVAAQVQALLDLPRP